MRHGASKGDNSTEIMACEHKMSALQAVRDAKNVADKIWHFVGLPILWLAALIKAALVGDDDTQTCFGKRRDLVTPAVPEFRKSMEENDKRSVLRACRDRVDCHIRQIKSQMLHLGDHEPS